MSAAPKVKEAIKFSVEVTNGPHAGMRLNFAKGSVTIGRGPENDIVLANDPRTSRQHAEIKQRDGEFLVVNLSSKKDRKSTRLNSSHTDISRMPSSA